MGPNDKRPNGSNADDWLLFLTESSPAYAAVQIAEALERAAWPEATPIEDAPKDGTPILAFMPTYYQGRGGFAVCWWMDFTDRPGWYSGPSSKHEPTQWWPLPVVS